MDPHRTHDTLPLLKAVLPTTIKQLRSWIGSYKQLSACIRDHSIPLTNLEKLTSASAASQTRIKWTNELKRDFEKAKQVLTNLQEGTILLF